VPDPPKTEGDARRVDPYESFKFKVLWQGRVVAGVNKISSLWMLSGRSGGEREGPGRSTGQADLEPITLEQGLTCDPAFQKWASRTWSGPRPGETGGEVPPGDSLEDITIELEGEADPAVRRWTLREVWPSRYAATRALAAGGNEVAIETLVLQYEDVLVGEVPPPFDAPEPIPAFEAPQ